jgi:trk system potassium uptake protein TrkA
VFIVVVGAGRLGLQIAESLTHAGHAVTLLDESRNALESLAGGFSGSRLEGDAAELEALKRSRMEEADVVVAVTEKDSLNLLVAQVARSVFGVPRVVARIYDPQTEEVYRHLDVDIVCPTSLSAQRILGILRDDPGASADQGD